MRGVGYLCATGKVIQPVQTGLLGDGIHPTEQQVHVVRFPASQATCEFPTDEAGHGARGEVGLVAHRVQGDVCLDVLRELDGVAWLAREGEEGVLVQLPGLVVGRLEDGGTAHGGFAGGDDGEIAAGEAKEDFPVAALASID